MKDFLRHRRLRLLYYFGIGAVYLSCCALLIYALERWFFPCNVLQEASMALDRNDRILLELASVGAAIAWGKLLVSGKKVTLRLIVGRLIIGAGLSVAAAATLMLQPNVPPMALVGLGSAFGILGQSCLEWLVQRWLGQSKTLNK